jgi:hypothetical protein
MKLITEISESVEYLIESAEVPEAKNYYIKGIFLQGNQKNRNGRIYPMDILIQEIHRYNTNYILQDRALGELGHPEGPTINLDKVSHKILELKQNGNNFIGKALILDTPTGKIVKSLIEANVKLGVSSRGVGSLKEQNGANYVQKDFILSSAADIVADPSVSNAFVNGIMEGVEWIWNNGLFKQQDLEDSKNVLEKTAKYGLMSEAFENARLKSFQKFLKTISSKL